MKCFPILSRLHPQNTLRPQYRPTSAQSFFFAVQFVATKKTKPNLRQNLTSFFFFGGGGFVALSVPRQQILLTFLQKNRFSSHPFRHLFTFSPTTFSPLRRGRARALAPDQLASVCSSECKAVANLMTL